MTALLEALPQLGIIVGLSLVIFGGLWLSR